MRPKLLEANGIIGMWEFGQSATEAISGSGGIGTSKM
jgi:hypothetical protein